MTRDALARLTHRRPAGSLTETPRNGDLILTNFAVP